MSYFKQAENHMKTKAITMVLASVFAIFSTPTMAKDDAAETYNIAVYRGAAGCPGCSEMVVKSLVNTGLRLHISYIGEKEKLKLSSQTLKDFDLYIQPGGGQDIPGSYKALGNEGAEAIRQFVENGNGFLGICMGAYLADKDWIGLIDAPLESEVGRPGSHVYDQGDYTLQLKWDNKREPFYYQDGPYLNSSTASTGFQPVAYYENGDIAIAKYKYGKGVVVLSGPHPEADETWIDTTMPGNTTAESKMQRLLRYFDAKKRQAQPDM